MEPEIWLPLEYDIITPDKYEISNYGNIRTNDITLKFDTSTGYNVLNLSVLRNNKYSQKHYRCHILTGLYFVHNPCPEKFIIINHLDGIKTNNYYKNLEWTTHSGNLIHAHKLGLRPSQKGESSTSNVHSTEFIEFICQELKSHNLNLETNLLVEKIMTIYNFDRLRDHKKISSLINHIRAKRRWTIVSDKYF